LQVCLWIDLWRHTAVKARGIWHWNRPRRHVTSAFPTPKTRVKKAPRAVSSVYVALTVMMAIAEIGLADEGDMTMMGCQLWAGGSGSLPKM